MEAVAEEKGFVPNFAEFEASRAGEPSWLAELRHAAIARFEELGFPTAKVEEWRYTGVGPIVAIPWALARTGQGQPALQSSSLSAGLRAARLKEVLAKEPETLRVYLSKIAGFEKDAFSALNAAFFDDGLLIEIAPGAVVERPIEILFDSADGSEPAVSHTRCLIVAGEASQATVVERYAGRGVYLQNAVTEIHVGDGAILSHYKLQQEDTAAFHVQTVAARQGRASRFTSHNIALGAALARTDIRVELAAEGSECELNGLFLGAGTQHLDNHTTIDHAMPHCVSRELYKGILDGRARGVFHGKIIVRPDAQKTDAMQTNKNLLLSKEALVNSTPALEILADDVKCRHGSTIGQLDANALFYLRSRGLGEEEARALLTYAFAADLADRIRVQSVRAAVESVLGQRLPGGSAREAIR
ncbi:MAG: Fe-S cluster assembly protein SufD [Thermoanaerobaculia bacterium]